MNQLINHELLNQLPGAIGYKDLNSNYITGNKQLAKYMGYTSAKDINGLTDFDIKSEMAELAHDYRIQDKKVIENGEEQHIDIGHYSDGDLQLHFSIKKPLINTEGKISGTVFSCIEIKQSFLTSLYHDVIKQNGPGLYHIGGKYVDFKLSLRESQCLFYLIRGFSAKEVANKLMLSAKTIEYYIVQLKEKFQCARKSELIDKAIALGFIFNIPLGIFPG